MRVLIEVGNALTRLDLTESLTAHGFDVTSCAGLSGACPLVQGDGVCEQVEQADVVVNALAAGQAEIYAAQRTRYPERAVLLLTDCLRDTDLTRVLDDVETGPSTAGGQELVERVARLVQEGRP